MKLNKAGFTLVELLASVVILAIMLGVAIPNITAVMKKQKNHVYVEDSKRLASQAKVKLNRDTSISKDPGTCFSLDFLDNGDFDEAPNGGVYLKDISYVYYAGKDDKNNDLYDLTLIECVNCKKGIQYTNYDHLDLRGISRVSYSDLINTNDYNSLVKVGDELYTGGVIGDTRCSKGYVDINEPPVSAGGYHQKEYRFDEVNCSIRNPGDNIYTYIEGQTWADYFNSEIYDLATVRSSYMVKDYFEGRFYLTFRSNCIETEWGYLDCESSDVAITDKIRPSDEGFYQVGDYVC